VVLNPQPNDDMAVRMRVGNASFEHFFQRQGILDGESGVVIVEVAIDIMLTQETPPVFVVVARGANAERMHAGIVLMTHRILGCSSGFTLPTAPHTNVSS
jgi:hypothetical protein